PSHNIFPEFVRLRVLLAPGSVPSTLVPNSVVSIDHDSLSRRQGPHGPHYLCDLRTVSTGWTNRLLCVVEQLQQVAREDSVVAGLQVRIRTHHVFPCHGLCRLRQRACVVPVLWFDLMFLLRGHP